MRLIDADALIEIFDKDKYDLARNEYKSGYNDGMFHAEVVADNQPTIDAVPVRHGKWIPKMIKIGGRDYASGMKCSACGEDALDAEGDEFLTDYCPNCGARMDAE